MATRKPKPPTVRQTEDLAFEESSAPENATAGGDIIHATECVLNSQCPFKDGCNGRLRQTPAVSHPKEDHPVVQIYCPKCRTFADGYRPSHGVIRRHPGELFDRIKAR